VESDQGHWRLDDRVADRYRVDAVVATGGAGTVYRVLDLRSNAELALKCLRTNKQDASAARLFRAEYQTLCQLTHPRIVRAYDYGVTAFGPYYTMELLDGIDVREAAPLPALEVCRLLRDVASALAMLHARRLLHRDVSYRNVRCTASGHAKLIDFGAMMPIGAAAELIGRLSSRPRPCSSASSVRARICIRSARSPIGCSRRVTHILRRICTRCSSCGRRRASRESRTGRPTSLPSSSGW
jgi:serine/threonine protein kinase